MQQSPKGNISNWDSPYSILCVTTIAEESANKEENRNY